LLEHILRASKDKGWREFIGNDICRELCQFEDAPWSEVNNFAIGHVTQLEVNANRRRAGLPVDEE
jgi:hypothetical protein